MFAQKTGLKKGMKNKAEKNKTEKKKLHERQKYLLWKNCVYSFLCQVNAIHFRTRRLIQNWLRSRLEDARVKKKYPVKNKYADAAGRIVTKKNSSLCECVFFFLKYNDTDKFNVFLYDLYFVSMTYIFTTSFNQHFLMMHCSLSPVKQMAYIYPHLYNCSVPAPFLTDLPQLAQLCGGTKPQLSSDRRMEQIFSMQGEKLISFAKSEKFVDGKTSQHI